MLIYRLENKEKIFYQISTYSLTLLVIVFIFFLAGSLSVFANYNTPNVVIQYFSSILSTFLLTLVFVNLKLNSQLIRFIFIAFACGSSFPLILGLYAYYQAWGIPHIDEIIFTHFNLAKMTEYGIQTFGNADNTAIFFGMAGVLFFGCLLNKNIVGLKKVIFGLCFLLAVLHLFILEIRTSIVCFFVVTLILSYIKDRKIFIAYILVVIGIFFIAYLFAPKFSLMFYNRMTLALTWTSQGSSQSATERINAMHIGWNIFMNHFILGVGPGGSKFFNQYSTAHQFNIQQGAELGVIGFISSILLCCVGIWRFFTLATRYYRLKQNYEKVILCSSAAFYFIYAIIANTPLANGVVNTWISLAILMLLFSD